MSDRDRSDHVEHIVAQWALERPDLDLGALALFGRLLRACALSDSLLGQTMKPHGLQRGWFDVLAALRRSGSPYELNPKALMEATMLTSGGVTKRLDALEHAGLVHRRPDPSDRRGTLVRLSRRGRAIVDRALKDHIAREQRLLSVLNQSEQRTLDRLLRKLLDGLEASERSDATP